MNQGCPRWHANRGQPPPNQCRGRRECTRVGTVQTGINDPSSSPEVSSVDSVRTSRGRSSRSTVFQVQQWHHQRRVQPLLKLPFRPHCPAQTALKTAVLVPPPEQIPFLVCQAGPETQLIRCEPFILPLAVPVSDEYRVGPRVPMPPALCRMRGHRRC